MAMGRRARDPRQHSGPQLGQRRLIICTDPYSGIEPRTGSLKGIVQHSCLIPQQTRLRRGS
jgi:hypothetical protein